MRWYRLALIALALSCSRIQRRLTMSADTMSIITTVIIGSFIVLLVVA